MLIKSSIKVVVLIFVAVASTMAQQPIEKVKSSQELLMEDFAETRLSHGPILGRPGPDSMSMWVRTHRPGKVHVRYGTDPNKLNHVSQPAITHVGRDNTGVLTLSGLKANTRYYYRVLDHQEAGSFRTLPRTADFRNEKYNPKGLFNFKFEFACGNNQHGAGDGAGPTLPAFNTLNRKVRDDIQFAILNGDWLYENRRDYPAAEWIKQVGVKPAAVPNIVKVAPSITGVWENYKTYLTRGRNLSEWHRHVPSFYTYDDHETLNDIYGTAEIGYVNRRAVFRDIGVRAWFDYLAWANPLQHNADAHFGLGEFKAMSNILTDPATDFTKLKMEDYATLHVHWDRPTAGVKEMTLDTESPGNPNAGVYKIVKVLDAHRVQISPPAKASSRGPYSLGRRCYGKFTMSNCDFFLVDTRSHRDLHDVDRPDKPGASMLGKQQLKWLKEGISKSKADFIFVVSSVNFMVPHVGSGGGKDLNKAVKKDDAWTVFLEEREELIQFWDKLEQPVFVLTGDLHNSFAIRITDNVWEFASGPHNSINHAPQDDEGNRPANGPFKYGPRACDIRWSTYVLNDIPRAHRVYPTYCVVQINNVFNNPIQRGGERWVVFPKPQVIFQFFDGLTGELRYSETVVKGQK